MKLFLFLLVSSLFFISVHTGCRKDTYNSSYVSPPLTPTDNTPKPPTFQTTDDSIITMIQFVEDRPILREIDTLYNSTGDHSAPVLVFWTKGNKKYVYRQSGFGTDDIYIADYTGKFDLIDTLQPPSPLSDTWADWAKAYSVNKQLMDSSVFTLQVSENVLNKMYVTAETKVIAASLPTSPIFIGRWINSLLNRIRGRKYSLSTGDSISPRDNIIKRINLDNKTQINKESDTTGNYILRIFLETETGKMFVYSGAMTNVGRYQADYVGKMDLINVTADTLLKPSGLGDSFAIFQINPPLVDTVGFVVQTEDAKIRKLYLSNKTVVFEEIQKMPIKFMATWYNMALNRLRGRRFIYAYYGHTTLNF